jgi:hypothetical protein
MLLMGCRGRNDIEKEVNRILTNRDLKTDPLTGAEAECMVAWFDLIDYKFQVISITRRFVTLPPQTTA